MKTPTYGNLIGFNPTGDLGPFTIYTAKNRKPVWYIKAPPTAPPTARQSFIRSRMAQHAAFWARQSLEFKAAWELASKNAQLRMNGYALYQWWLWHSDRAKLRTIEHQSGVTLPGT